MELTDGQRIVLAILSEPVERRAIGGGIEPIPVARVADIWSTAMTSSENLKDRSTPQHTERAI